MALQNSTGGMWSRGPFSRLTWLAVEMNIQWFRLPPSSAGEKEYLSYLSPVLEKEEGEL